MGFIVLHDLLLDSFAGVIMLDWLVLMLFESQDISSLSVNGHIHKIGCFTNVFIII